MTAEERSRLDRVIEETLKDLELTYEHPSDGAFLVTLPGDHKLTTMTWLLVQDFSLLIEAFFMRKPEDDPAAVHDWMLKRNAHMYGLAFSIDQLGDVYLVGKLPLSAVEPDEIDRLLGCMLRYSDDGFDTAVALGFETSIRREWAWRVKRGESTANLAAFPQFAGEDLSKT
ncbi:MAG TPA: YbjN domain-containing protein [Frankiaceae bacterium]|nr:YbjN domain-containing protein [Frankiaceae bacterium]